MPIGSAAAETSFTAAKANALSKALSLSTFNYYSHRSAYNVTDRRASPARPHTQHFREGSHRGSRVDTEPGEAQLGNLGIFDNKTNLGTHPRSEKQAVSTRTGPCWRHDSPVLDFLLSQCINPGAQSNYLSDDYNSNLRHSTSNTVERQIAPVTPFVWAF